MKKIPNRAEALSSNPLTLVKQAAHDLGNDPPNSLTTIRALTALHVAVDEIERLTAERCQDPECHTDFQALFEEKNRLRAALERIKELGYRSSYPYNEHPVDIAYKALAGAAVETEPKEAQPEDLT